MQSICWPDYFRNVVLSDRRTFDLCEGPHGVGCLVNQYGPPPGAWRASELKLVNIESAGPALRVKTCPVEGNEQLVFYVMLPAGIVEWEPLRESS